MVVSRAMFLAVVTVFFFINSGTCNICVPTCDGIQELYPDPVDCGKFYQCAHGTPYRMDCPLSLFFSPSLLRCEYPSRANCTSNPALVCGGPNQDQTTVIPEAQPFVASKIRPLAFGIPVGDQSTQVSNTAPVATSSPIPPSASQTSGAPTSPAATTKAPDSCILSCPSPDAQFPYPSDCTKYVQCVDNVPYIRLCPPGLEYSSTYQRCDWPATAQCTATSDTPCSTATPSVVTSTQAPNSCVPPCPSPEALYPHPNDCTKYFHCAANVPYLKSCPVGQEYSGPLERCDWPEIAQCTATPDAPCVAITYSPVATTVVSTTQDPNACVPPCPSPEALYPHPNDCTKYFHCARNVPYLKSCPVGQEYSGPLERCDWPEIAQCTATPDAPCVAITYSPVATTVVSATQDPNACVPPCPSPEALYPHPNDCTKYFHCAKNVPYLKPCPAGQEYSGPLKRCDWPEIAQCTASPEAPCVADTNTYPTQSTPSACKPPCPWPYAYMPHPQDCTKFYICDGQRNAFEASCQPGLVYSVDTVRCDYPDIAVCHASPQNPCDAYIAP